MIILPKSQRPYHPRRVPAHSAQLAAPDGMEHRAPAPRPRPANRSAGFTYRKDMSRPPRIAAPSWLENGPEMRSRAPSALKRAPDVTPGPMIRWRTTATTGPCRKLRPPRSTTRPLQEPQRRRSFSSGERDDRSRRPARVHARAAAHGDQPTPQSATPPRCTPLQALNEHAQEARRRIRRCRRRPRPAAAERDRGVLGDAGQRPR